MRIWTGPWRWFNESMPDCCEPQERIKQKGIAGHFAHSTGVDGLLGLMPIGCRNVTYIPEGAMAELAKGETADADIGKLPGVQSWAHGPYLDDWSKVPAEIATKYNTSPSFGK